MPHNRLRASEQATLGDSTPDLDRDQLQYYIEHCKWSISEVADEFNVSEDDVEHAIHHHDIDYDRHSVGASTSGLGKKLWEMDPDDLPTGGESA